MSTSGMSQMREHVDGDNLTLNWTSMTRPNNSPEDRPYHHGDLQRAIVSAAL
jgi:hypothetical protein